MPKIIILGRLISWMLVHILNMRRIHNLAGFIGESYNENDFPSKIDVELLSKHNIYTNIERKLSFTFSIYEIKTNLLCKYYLILEYQHTIVRFKR